MGFLQSKSGSNQNVEGRRLISTGNCSGGIKLGQVTSSVLKGQLREDLLLKTELGSSHPTFPFPSQSMPWGRRVALSSPTKTFSEFVLPSCHTSHALSTDAGRPYFQMPIAIFIAVSLLFPFPTWKNCTPGTSYAGSCRCTLSCVGGPLQILSWGGESPLGSPLVISLCFILGRGQCSALLNFLHHLFLTIPQVTLFQLTGPVSNLEYISSPLGH